MTAITTRLPAVAVEYDTNKGRATKQFEDANDAKVFFTAKEKAGRNPRVLGDSAPAAEAATPTTDKDPAAPVAAPTAPKAAGKRRTKAQPDAAPTKAAAVATTPKPPGIAPNARTRAYCAGLILKKYSPDDGITDAMVAELDAMYGKPNKVESSICLRNAWAVRRALMEN